MPKDISQLSYLPEEEEVLLLPFSTFEVEEVVQNQNQSIKFKLVELPLPRQSNVIMWVDDHSKNNNYYVQELENKNPNISIVFCRSSNNVNTLVQQCKWMISLEGSNFRIIIDMENGKLNYLAGIDLLRYLFQEIKYKNQVSVFCRDIIECYKKFLVVEQNYEDSGSKVE